MIGLILKDFYAVRKQLKFYAILIGFFILMGVNDPNNMNTDFMISFFAIMMPISALAYDERSKWHKYALTMPLKRKDLVLSKYYLGLIYMGIGFLINVLLGVALITLSSRGVIPAMKMGLADLFVRNVISVLTAVLFFSVVMPLFFKLGVETGRVVMMVMAFTPVVLILVLSNIFPEPPAFFSTVGMFFDANLSMIAGIGVLVVLLAVFVSILVSILILEKKEF